MCIRDRHHADHAAGIFHVAEPCTFPMKRHIRESLAKVICFFHALTHMKNRMSLPKCNCLFYKGKHAGISSQSPPVNPANGIVLAVSIIVSVSYTHLCFAFRRSRRCRRVLNVGIVCCQDSQTRLLEYHRYRQKYGKKRFQP